MTELRRTIDEIRFVLQDDAFAITDQLMQYVTEYSTQCHEANVRLRKCEEFLNQGLRSEALHLAEITPNLLDLVATLDFPEREQWVNLLSGYSLPKPEPLLFEVAATLNEAYALQEPLQRLLDRHRLYALARSPLVQRLSVLRSLTEVDPASGHWEADTRAMERARFREIESEARAAIGSGEVESLKSLVSELSSKVWLETVPPELLREVKQRGGHVVRSQAREQLEMLVETLHDAHAALNVALARQMRDAWNVNAKVVQLAEQDPLAEQAAPVLQWLDDEDRREAAEKNYRRALLDLEQALDQTSLNSLELQKFGHAVEKCGRGIPEALRTRYRRQIASLDLGESRRNFAKIGGVVGAIVAVVAVICVAVYFSHEAETSRRILAAVSERIDEHKLDEARKLLEEHPQRALTEAGLAMKSKLATATQIEHDRQAKLNEALDRARQATGLEAVATALQQARDLVRTTDEKIAVGKLEADWTVRRNADVAKAEQQFRTQLATTTGKLRTLDGLLTNPGADAEIRKLLEQVQAELSSLHTLEPKVASELTSQATLLESRFGAFRKTHVETLKKNVLLDKLAALVLIPPLANPTDSQLAEYRDTLTQFVTSFPTDPRIPAFKDSGNLDVMKAALRRHKMAAGWMRLWPADKYEVEPRIKDCTTFLTEFPHSPDREFVNQYLAFLKSLEWREKGDEDSEEPVQARLEKLFLGKFMQEGYVLRGKDGKVYYLEQSFDFTNRMNVSFKYVVGFNDEVKSIKDMGVDQLETLKTELPPQKAFAEQVMKTAAEVSQEEWSSYLKDRVQDLLVAKSIDSFLRYFLTVRILTFASQGDSFLAVELKKTLRDLNDNPPDMSVSWMDPNNAAAKASRSRSELLLKRISNTSLDDAWKRAVAAQGKLSADLFRQTLPVGWLERTADRRWILRTKWTSEKKHSLLVSVAAEDGTRTWQQVGVFQAGTTEWNLPVIGAMAEGTVVFATSVPVKGP